MRRSTLWFVTCGWWGWRWPWVETVIKVVNEEGGTGSNARVAGLNIAGKTGTVQVIAQSGWFSTAGLPFMSRDHAWFASYAPQGNPQMVVVVFVEHAGAHGGTDAAPLAKLLYQSAFSQEVAAHLDLTDPALLEMIKKGQIPVPGQEPKQEAQPADANLGH